jgi:nitroreductase
MNTTEAIRARRSIRKYKQGAVIPQEHIDLMLEAAMCAPSAANKRPWRFIVVENADARQAITEALGHNLFFIDASLAIVICGDPGSLPDGPKEGFWQQDCAAAAENLLLQATELGYGTCWTGAYPGMRGPVVTKILGIKDVIPVMMIAVGIPDETPPAKGFYDKTKVRYVR